MNKQLLYTLGLAACMTACTEDYTDWAAPQVNAHTAISAAFTFTATEVETIDLAEVETQTVSIFTPELTGPALNEYYLVSLTDDITLTADASGAVSVEELTEAVTTTYGKSPEERTFEATILCYANLEDGELYKSATEASVTVKVIPDSPVLDEAYYLVGDFCGWDAASMLAFTHSDSDVYDDPEFTIVFTVSGTNQYWKIIPQSDLTDDGSIGWTSAVMGVATNGDSSLEGSLVQGDCGAGVIAEAGTYRMVINVMDMTYTITAVADLALYYVTGNPNSWSDQGTIIAFPQGNNEYNVTAYFSSSWDFKIWEEANLGDWSTMIGCPSDDCTSKPTSGQILTSNVECFTSPAAGYYTCTLDMTNLVYTWTALDTPTEYEQIGVVGNGDDWDNDVFLTQVGTSHNWMGTITIANCTWGVKFRADAAWNQDWGADVNIADQWYGTGVLWGSNITIPDGTYTIYFNDITGDFAFIAQ